MARRTITRLYLEDGLIYTSKGELFDGLPGDKGPVGDQGTTGDTGDPEVLKSILRELKLMNLILKIGLAGRISELDGALDIDSLRDEFASEIVE